MQFVRLNDVYKFGVTTHNPSGGALKNTDETPRWSVFENDSDTAILEGNFTSRTGFIGTYKGSFHTSGVNGFNSNSYYELHASGKIDGIVGRAIISNFVIDDIVNANIVQISGDATASNNLRFQYDGVTGLNGGTFPATQAQVQSVYYADIKYIKDIGNSADEYSVRWFKDSVPVASGDLTNPAISVFRTSNGASVFSNQTMDYISPALGTVKYNTGLLTASGEAFIVSVSGTIDSATRTWEKIVGLDDIF